MHNVYATTYPSHIFQGNINYSNYCFNVKSTKYTVKPVYKRPLKRGVTSILIDRWHLNADPKYCRKLLWELSAILLSYIKLPPFFRVHTHSSMSSRFYCMCRNKYFFPANKHDYGPCAIYVNDQSGCFTQLLYHNEKFLCAIWPIQRLSQFHIIVVQLYEGVDLENMMYLWNTLLHTSYTGLFLSLALIE